MSAKATVCKSCGAPRDPSISHALCRECYRMHESFRMTEHLRNKALTATYARLGLKVGQVWKAALR